MFRMKVEPTTNSSASEYVAITAAGALHSQMAAKTKPRKGTPRQPLRVTRSAPRINSGNKAPASSSAKSLR